LGARSLGQAGCLEAVFDAVFQLGFHEVCYIHVGSYAKGLDANWIDYDDQILNELDVAYEKGHLSFMIRDDQKDELSYLSLWLDFSWEYRADDTPTKQVFYAQTHESQFFTQAEFDREFYAQRMLAVGMQLYPILRPEFGWMERCPIRGYTSMKDVESLALPHIYWANFFGPGYAENLGSSFLENAPGWKKQSLDDGGFLYVLSPNMVGTGRNKLGTEVKAYFEADSVRRK
jgi:hypothetical protein